MNHNAVLARLLTEATMTDQVVWYFTTGLNTSTYKIRYNNLTYHVTAFTTKAKIILVRDNDSVTMELPLWDGVKLRKEIRRQSIRLNQDRIAKRTVDRQKVVDRIMGFLEEDIKLMAEEFGIDV